MSAKSLVMIGMVAGSTIGSYGPMLFGVDVFSLWSLFWGAVGGLLGIWLGFKLASLLN